MDFWPRVEPNTWRARARLGLMGPLVVITLQLLGSDLPDLIERFKHTGGEHLSLMRTIEPLDERGLLWLAWLDVP